MARVYLDYDLEALEREYAGSAREPELDAPKAAREARIEAANRRVRDERPRLLDFVYGVHERQRLDYYPTAEDFAPLFVFIHGGYWKSRSKDMFAYLAPAFTDAGVNFAAVGYPLAPEVRLADIVDSCRRAIHWLMSYQSGRRFDPTRVHVGGHSAGGHLAAMMLATDWRDFGLPRETIKSATCISGLYDLEPLRLCRQHRDLAIDAEEARTLSPLRLKPPYPGTLIATVGGREGAEFQRNTRELIAAWTGRVKALKTPAAAKFHHYNVLDEVVRKGAPLNAAIMATVKTERPA